MQAALLLLLHPCPPRRAAKPRWAWVLRPRSAFSYRPSGRPENQPSANWACPVVTRAGWGCFWPRCCLAPQRQTPRVGMAHSPSPQAPVPSSFPGVSGSCKPRAHAWHTTSLASAAPKDDQRVREGKNVHLSPTPGLALCPDSPHNISCYHPYNCGMTKSTSQPRKLRLRERNCLAQGPHGQLCLNLGLWLGPFAFCGSTPGCLHVLGFVLIPKQDPSPQ